MDRNSSNPVVSPESSTLVAEAFLVVPCFVSDLKFVQRAQKRRLHFTSNHPTCPKDHRVLVAVCLSEEASREMPSRTPKPRLAPPMALIWNH